MTISASPQPAGAKPADAPLLPPLQTADLPERTRPFWKMTGPGAVLVGLSIGAGEIVVWPVTVAQYGATMIWAAAMGVFIQLWVNFEIGRWTIATGESTYTGFARLWRGYAHTFILLNIAGWLLPGWARASGAALKALLMGPAHPSPDWLWTGITFIGAGLVLFGPKRIYVAVERTIGVLVFLITAGLIYIAFSVGSWDTVKQMGAGLINFGHIEKEMAMKEFFSALVFAGAGGTANLFYAFYLRDKHIGMGARIPMLINPLRQREETATQSGYIFPETPENVRRFKDWFRYILLDQTLYFWALNTFTIMLFIFGSLAVLHPAGIVPSSGSLIWDEAAVLEQSMGRAGRYLFLIIGMATLFSTQVTLVDGVSRSMADIFSSSFRWGKRLHQARWYLAAALFIMAFGTILTGILEYYKIGTLDFLFNAAYMGGYAMAIYTPLLLWMNLRHLPKSARPKPLNVVMVSIAAGIYIFFAAFSLTNQIRELTKEKEPVTGGSEIIEQREN